MKHYLVVAATILCLAGGLAGKVTGKKVVKEKVMGEKLKPLPEGPITQPMPFATHPVVMIICFDRDADDPMADDLKACLEQQKTITVTSPNLLKTVLSGNKTLMNVVVEKWIVRRTKNACVLIPRDFNDFPELPYYDQGNIYKPRAKDSNPTMLELLLGIAVDHLEKFDPGNIVNLPEHPDCFRVLGKRFVDECKAEIFVPRRAYAKSTVAVPRFAFVLNGHGLNSQAGFEENKRLASMRKKIASLKDLTQDVKDKLLYEQIKVAEQMLAEEYNYATQEGTMVALPISVFSRLLSFLNIELQTTLAFIISCLSGGRNLEAAFVDMQTRQLKTYSFVVVVAALTEASIKLAAKIDFSTFARLVRSTPELPDLKKLSECMVDLEPQYYPQMIPLVKYPWSDQHFQVLDLPEHVVSLGRTLVRGREKLLDISSYFGGRMIGGIKQKKIYPDIILLYQRNYPFWIKISKDPKDVQKVPWFISMVQGPSYHTFEGLDASDFEFDSWLHKFLFKNLELEVEKVFFFREVRIQTQASGSASKKVKLKNLFICPSYSAESRMVFFQSGSKYFFATIKVREKSRFEEIDKETYAKKLVLLEKQFEGLREDVQTLDKAFKEKLAAILKQGPQKPKA